MIVDNQYPVYQYIEFRCYNIVVIIKLYNTYVILLFFY